MSNISSLAEKPSNNTQLTCPVEILPHGEGLSLPKYATSGSAGMDLYAAIDAPMTLKPLERALVKTGIKMALPDGYEAQIRPRSGLSYKNGLTVLNAPGTIDSDYRGEICVLLINLSNEDFVIEREMRIAQMVIAQYEQISWNQVSDLDETERGQGGFGHTGIK